MRSAAMPGKTAHRSMLVGVLPSLGVVTTLPPTDAVGQAKRTGCAARSALIGRMQWIFDSGAAR